MCGDGTPLFLQIKEAGKSVLERLGQKFKGHQGQRVVEGQRIMQASSDIFLGWTEGEASNRQFYVRQLKTRLDQRSGGGAGTRELRAPVRPHACPRPCALS
jgi:hypothetical protein